MSHTHRYVFEVESIWTEEKVLAWLREHFGMFQIAIKNGQAIFLKHAAADGIRCDANSDYSLWIESRTLLLSSGAIELTGV